jgi:hypothetical protein
MTRSLFAAASVALALAVSPSAAFADTFELSDIPFTDGPAHQCHNPHTNGGNLQVDWDFLGFDAGNPHGHIFLNNLRIDFSLQSAFVDDLHKPSPGNEIQDANLFFAATTELGATFNYDNIQAITLESVGPADFRGTQVRPLGQAFVLTIVTDTETLVFDLESIMGSQINFDRNGRLTGMNLRFCGNVDIVPPPPPPPIPEPASLFAVGLAGMSLVGAARRKLGRRV